MSARRCVVLLGRSCVFSEHSSSCKESYNDVFVSALLNLGLASRGEPLAQLHSRVLDYNCTRGRKTSGVVVRRLGSHVGRLWLDDVLARSMLDPQCTLRFIDVSHIIKYPWTKLQLCPTISRNRKIAAQELVDVLRADCGKASQFMKSCTYSSVRVSKSARARFCYKK